MRGHLSPIAGHLPGRAATMPRRSRRVSPSFRWTAAHTPALVWHAAALASGRTQAWEQTLAAKPEAAVPSRPPSAVANESRPASLSATALPCRRQNATGLPRLPIGSALTQLGMLAGYTARCVCSIAQANRAEYESQLACWQSCGCSDGTRRASAEPPPWRPQGSGHPRLAPRQDAAGNHHPAGGTMRQPE